MQMLQAKDIYKGFDGVEVLKGISFQVNKGDVLAIIGPSGSGKSTLLRCLFPPAPPRWCFPHDALFPVG